MNILLLFLICFVVGSPLFSSTALAISDENKQIITSYGTYVYIDNYMCNGKQITYIGNYNNPAFCDSSSGPSFRNEADKPVIAEKKSAVADETVRPRKNHFCAMSNEELTLYKQCADRKNLKKSNKACLKYHREYIIDNE